MFILGIGPKALHVLDKCESCLQSLKMVLAKDSDTTARLLLPTPTRSECLGCWAPFRPQITSEKQVPQVSPTCCSDSEGDLSRTTQEQVA